MRGWRVMCGMITGWMCPRRSLGICWPFWVSSRRLRRLFVSLTMWLGHENAYVRTSAAAAIADAVEHHPQTGHGTIDALQALYREKVCRFVLRWSCAECVACH